MITGVAIKDRKTGNVHSLPKPNRHHHLFPHLIEKLGYTESKDARFGEQGFVDENGKFYDRVTALDYVKACGQVFTKNGSPHELYSEDLW